MQDGGALDRGTQEDVSVFIQDFIGIGEGISHIGTGIERALTQVGTEDIAGGLQSRLNTGFRGGQAGGTDGGQSSLQTPQVTGAKMQIVQEVDGTVVMGRCDLINLILVGLSNLCEFTEKIIDFMPDLLNMIVVERSHACCSLNQQFIWTPRLIWQHLHCPLILSLCTYYADPAW